MDFTPSALRKPGLAMTRACTEVGLIAASPAPAAPPMTQPMEWARQLTDARGKKVAFLSHCLLNENTRFLGGACERGAVGPVLRDCLERGYGIVQLPCPEQLAWGGVLKRHLLRFFGSRHGWLRRATGLALPLLLWYTRVRYRWLARQVAAQCADYVRSGFEVVGVVGVDGSPSCGVGQTLAVGPALERLARLEPTARRGDVSAIVLQTLAPGRGLFMRALQREFARRGLRVPTCAFDMPSELRGLPSGPVLGDR